MLGLMQDWPLLIHKVIDHAAREHGGAQGDLALRRGADPRDQLSRGARPRAAASPSASTRDGIRLGDRVATLAWNTWRHLETWYGITGIGAIYHTVNPRLFEDQIVYIINHAEDRILFLDLTFVPLIEKIAARLPSVERFVVLTDARAHAGDEPAQRRRLRGLARRGRRRFRLARASTRTPRRASATPPARRATPRACSIRTAPTCCTR